MTVSRISQVSDRSQRSFVMVNSQTLQGNWNEVKGLLRNRWNQLSGDDLHMFDGNVDRLVGLIQRKTGEARQAIEQFLEEASANGASAISGTMESARQAAQYASNQVQATARTAVDTAKRGYEDAQEIVQRRPVESAAVLFGSGLLAGVVIGLLMRSR
jgi:uncharacterized protein YjbJ (UPF0337 family)